MGTAIARKLSKYMLKIIVLEKESDVCFGTSKATTALVHTGYQEKSGTLKRNLISKGHTMMKQLCAELDVPFRIIGRIDNIAFDDRGLKKIEELKKVGDEDGFKTMSIVVGDEILKLEPILKDNIKGALYIPEYGIVSPYELVIALMENAIDNGARLFLNYPVIDISRDAEHNLWVVKTPKDTINCQCIINSSGIFADHVSNMAGAETYEIKPEKGEEYVFDTHCKLSQSIKHIIVGAGGLLFPTTHGNAIMGTTRVMTNRDDLDTTTDGFNQIFNNISKLVKGLNKKDIITSFAGLRAQNNKTDDYIICPSDKVPFFVHVSVGSPGFAASPAVAEMVEGILLNHYHIPAHENKSFNPYRKAIPVFRELSQEKKEELIKLDERYGHIVCRCETITEGEIVEAINRGARTLDGIKYRTRAGMGRCQGGFCTPRILNILARELHVSVTELTKKGNNSTLLPYQTKQLYFLEGEKYETY